MIILKIKIFYQNINYINKKKKLKIIKKEKIWFLSIFIFVILLIC